MDADVLGVNDGLVSNLSLIVGVAGAALQQRSSRITNDAGGQFTRSISCDAFSLMDQREPTPNRPAPPGRCHAPHEPACPAWTLLDARAPGSCWSPWKKTQPARTRRCSTYQL